MSKAQQDSKELLTLVGSRLKQIRIRRGFTNYEHFAYSNDINRVQYGRYEQGKSDMRLSSLKKVLDALDISFEEFFAEGFDSDIIQDNIDD